MDVIEGRGPAPRLVISMVQRLPDTCLTSALMAGGKDHFGWGADRHLSADLYDALNLNTKATGQWKKGKAPDFPEWPRPTSRADTDGAKTTRATVKDLYRKFSKRG